MPSMRNTRSWGATAYTTSTGKRDPGTDTRFKAVAKYILALKERGWCDRLLWVSNQTPTISRIKKLKSSLNSDPSQLLYMQDAGVSYRDKISQNIRNLYSFGNGWWFQGNEIEIFCGDGSFNKLEYKDQCKTLPGHMQYVNKVTESKAGAIC